MRILAKPIAHRGLHDETRPENSMAAFQNAVEHGYHIETDVHLSKDGVLFAFHDFSLKRMTGKKVKIEKLTSAELKSGEYTLPNGETIPTFQELLDLVDGKTDILCELKSVSAFGHYKLEEAVYEAVKGKDWVTLQSFNPLSVKWFRKNHPDVVCGQLATYGDNFLLKAVLRLFGGVTLLNWTGAQFLAYDVKFLPNPRVDKAVADHDIPLLSWTIHAENVETARAAKVDQLIFEGFLAGDYPNDVAAATENSEITGNA